MKKKNKKKWIRKGLKQEWKALKNPQSILMIFVLVGIGSIGIMLGANHFVLGGLFLLIAIFLFIRDYKPWKKHKSPRTLKKSKRQ